jgi:hypothetical protein
VKGNDVKVVFTAPNGTKTSKTLPADDRDLRRPTNGGNYVSDIPLMKSAGIALRDIALHGDLDRSLKDLNAQPLQPDSMLAQESAQEQSTLDQVQHAHEKDCQGAEPCTRVYGGGANNVEAVIQIGSSVTGEKCVQAQVPVSCPLNSGDMDIRRNPDGGSESYDVTVSGGKTVCVRRSDKNDGWTQNLQLVCNKQTTVTVQVGTSETALKCVMVFPSVTCSWNAANYGIRSDTDSGSEDGSFHVESLRAGASTSQSRVCVRRLDGVGWDFNVEFLCNVLDAPFVYQGKVVELERSPNRNDHCKVLTKMHDQVQCPGDADQFMHAGVSDGPGAPKEPINAMQFDVVAEYAFERKPVLGGARICARRVDRADGWKVPLQLVCSGTGHILVGPSLNSNLKCVNVDQPVTCTESAADVDNRVNKDDDLGIFDVTSNGHLVCVRRKDRVEGWSMDLTISCTPMAGFRHEAIGDKGIATLQSSSRRRREAWLLEAAAAEDPLDANVVTDGMLVWLQHDKLGWFHCSTTECLVDKHQAPERFRIFSDSQRGNAALMNGATVYIRHEASLQYVACDNICMANSECPVVSGRGTDFSKCTQERFRIYNSAGAGPIRDGDSMYLVHSSSKLLSCELEMDPCLVNGLCASGSDARSFLKDVGDAGCSAERMRIFSAPSRAGQKQASSIQIGTSEASIKCVQQTGPTLTCAKNAGDAGLRYPVLDTLGDKPNFEITTRASIDNDEAWEVCAKRTDKDAGWSIQLNISCVKRALWPSWPHDVPSPVMGELVVDEKSVPVGYKPSKCLGWAPSSGLWKGKGNYCATWGLADPWCWVSKDYNGPGHAFMRQAEGVDLQGRYFSPCTPSATKPLGVGPGGPGHIPNKQTRGRIAKSEVGDNAAQKAADKAAEIAGKAAYEKYSGNPKMAQAAKKAAEEAMKAAVSAGVTAAVNAAAESAAISAAKAAGAAVAQAAAEAAKFANSITPKKISSSSTQDAVPQICYQPAPGCRTPFKFNDKTYVGCVKDTKTGSSWCSNKAYPDALVDSDWKQCRIVPCSEVCFRPHYKCMDPFNYQTQPYAGCIRESSGEAWCSHVQTWSEAAFAQDEWSWCEPMSCNSACWEPSSACMTPFHFAGKARKGCVASDDPSKPAWCSTKSDFQDGDTDFIYCKQAKCSEPPMGRLGGGVGDSQQRVVSPGMNFIARGQDVVCTGGMEIFTGKHSFHDCAKKCEKDTNCKSFQYTFGSSCPQCTLSTSSCETTGPADCDGHINSYQKAMAILDASANVAFASRTTHIVESAEQTFDGTRLLGGQETGEFPRKQAREFSRNTALPNTSRVTHANKKASPQGWSVSSPPEQGPPGHASCPCVGIVGHGTLETTIEKTGDNEDGFVNFPMMTGAGCNAWDEGYHPSCKVGVGSERPDWCGQKWCFVDPCNCNSADFYRKSTLFGDATYQGKSLAYSYLTCGAEDHHQAPDPSAEAWRVGSGKNGARTANDAIECSTEAAVANDLGMYNCRCIGFSNVSGVLSLGKDDGASTSDFTADTGSSCAVWDMSSSPHCSGNSKNLPKWCGKEEKDEPWCFVDPCSCGIAVPPEPAVMAPGLKIGNRPVFYSRATCQPSSTYFWSDRAMATSCLGLLDKSSCESAKVGDCIWTDDGICVDHLRQSCPKEALLAMVPASGQSSKDPAMCRKEMCPYGMALKSSAVKGTVRCSQTPCATFDIFTCCAQSATCDTFGDCGDAALLRKGVHHCQGVACTFASDYNTCCQRRASCSSFPADKCPAGTAISEDANATCAGRDHCDATEDAERCCEESGMSVFSMLVGGFIFFALVVLGCFIRTMRADPSAGLKQRKLGTTREDPADGQVYTFTEFQAKYEKQKIPKEEIDKMWLNCRPVMDKETAALKMQAAQRAKSARKGFNSMMATRKTNDGTVCSFSEFRAKNPNVPLEELKAQFLTFPSADKVEMALPPMP